MTRRPDLAPATPAELAHLAAELRRIAAPITGATDAESAVDRRLTGRRHARRRRRVGGSTVAAIGLLAAGVVALRPASRSDELEQQATPPATSLAAATNTAGAVSASSGATGDHDEVPAAGSKPTIAEAPSTFDYQSPELTEFPVLDAPLDSIVTARAGGLAAHPDNSYYVQTAIARRNGDQLEPGVLVQAFERFDRHPDFFDSTGYERGTIDGRTVGVRVSPGEAPGTGPFTSVVIDPDSDIPIVIDGTDALGFLRDVGVGFADVQVARDDEGLIPVDMVLHLSTDYVVVVEPQLSPLGSRAATLSITGELGEPQTLISVGIEPYPIALDVKAHQLKSIDVAGRPGWVFCESDLCRITWTTVGGAFASVSYTGTWEETLAIAEAVTFVGRVEWGRRYP